MWIIRIAEVHWLFWSSLRYAWAVITFFSIICKYNALTLLCLFSKCTVLKSLVFLWPQGLELILLLVTWPILLFSRWVVFWIGFLGVPLLSFHIRPLTDESFTSVVWLPVLFACCRTLDHVKTEVHPPIGPSCLSAAHSHFVYLCVSWC